jgi:hypothetical protein
MGLRLVVFAVSCALTASCLAQQSAKRTFSLVGRVQVPLTSDWTQRIDIDPPPVPQLLTSAPDFGFTDFLALENRAKPSALELGLSGNPFFGRDAVWMDTHTHETLLSTLFYLFFPSPRVCLARAQAGFEAQLRKKEEEAEAAAESDKSRKKGRSSIGPVGFTRGCNFTVTPLDFFASQLSPAINFAGTRAEQHIHPSLRSFYLGPMEQLELGPNTFFIFEARADHPLQLPVVQQFGLRDDRQGTRAHFFWAIGAATPFPFVRDPQRKDLQIFHVAYANLGLNGEAREEFQSLLRTIQFGP